MNGACSVPTRLTGQGSHAWLGVSPAILLLVIAGCKVGGTGFSMDSNSRTPALGLSLVPRQSEPKVEEDAPGGGSPPPRLASAELEAPAPRKSTRPETDPAAGTGAESPPPTSGNRLTSWLRPGKSEKKRIALPRTDLDEDEEWDDEDAEE